MKKTIQYEFERGTVLSLKSIAGRTLRVVSGQVWLTESAQRTDIVIEACGYYQPISNQLVVLEALSDARIEMDVPASAKPLHFLNTVAYRSFHWSMRIFSSSSGQFKKVKVAPSLG